MQRHILKVENNCFMFYTGGKILPVAYLDVEIVSDRLLNIDNPKPILKA